MRILKLFLIVAAAAVSILWAASHSVEGGNTSGGTESRPADLKSQTATVARSAWARCRETLQRVLDLEGAKETLPSSSWFRFDQQDADRKIAALLGEVSEALEISSMSDCRERYARLEHNIREAERRISEALEKSLVAPEAASLNPFTKSKKDFEKAVAKLKEKISACDDEKRAAVEQLRKEYDQIGVHLTARQLQFYLSSVSGKDIVGLSATFQNVRELNDALAKMVQECPQNADVARRYYSLHVVMIKALMQSHDTVLARIEGRYLPKIGDLREQILKVVRETESLIRDAGAQDRAALEGHLRAQKATVHAMDVYGKHLHDLQSRVRESLDGVRRRYVIAQNASATIKVASLMVHEMQTCIKDLTLLQEMHLPDLVPMDSTLLEQKFTEITASLQ